MIRAGLLRAELLTWVGALAQRDARRANRARITGKKPIGIESPEELLTVLANELYEEYNVVYRFDTEDKQE